MWKCAGSCMCIHVGVLGVHVCKRMRMVEPAYATMYMCLSVYVHVHACVHVSMTVCA